MRFAAVLVALSLSAACAARSPLPHLATDESNEVAFLIHAGTANSLATASLLAHLVQGEDEGSDSVQAGPVPAELIERAVSAAPDRPELVWLEWRDCEPRHCPEEDRIVARLKALDPDNGMVWLPDLHEALGTSASDVTEVLVKMGGARGLRLYWNTLAVMMFDALTHRDPARPPTAITESPDDRLTHIVALLSAVNVPTFQWIVQSCRFDQFELPGRRSACEALMSRLEAADAAICENLGLTVQESWWPAGSAEYAAVRRRHLQQRYLAVASNRLRKGHEDRDAELRVDAMRRFEREDDVERAMLKVYHEPVERPADWRMPVPR